MDVNLPDLCATERLGHSLGMLLFPDAIVALVGQLGAGKTHLSRAITEGLGVPDSRVVTSPTFVLVQEYEGGRLPVYHFDAYRLSSENEFLELGIREYFEGKGVCVIEWADRVTDCLPLDHLVIRLTVTGPLSRQARLEATGPLHAKLLADLSRMPNLTGAN